MYKVILQKRPLFKTERSNPMNLKHEIAISVYLRAKSVFFTGFAWNLCCRSFNVTIFKGYDNPLTANKNNCESEMMRNPL